LPDTRPLGIPAFRRLWGASVVTAVGGAFTAYAVPLQVYQLTGSSAYVGLAVFVGLAPLVVFALWGGAVADAFDRRRVLLVTDGGLAVCALGLWALAAAGPGSVGLLLVLVGVQQAFAGAGYAVYRAAVPRLVPMHQFPAATALSATVGQAAQVAGPLLAGALVPLTGLAVLYLADAAALGVAVWAVWRLPPIPPLTPAPGVAAAVPAERSRHTTGRRLGVRALAEGFRYLVVNRVLLVAMAADVIAMVLGMPVALFPELAQETFGDPREGGLALGVLLAAWPAGYVLGGLVSGAVTRARRHGVMLTAAVSAWGVAVAALGLSPHLWLAAGSFALGGAACFALTVFRESILQAAAPDELRGRLQGIMTVVSAGGPRLGALLHGVAGATLGTTWAITGGGVLVVAAMLTTAAAAPAFWHYRAPAPPGRTTTLTSP
jgi:MFS family permease